VAEEIYGVLFWKAKTMLLAGGNHTWGSDELSKLIEDLITVYHEARRGAHELETRLEALLIGIK
jgi:hypothetical protein